MAIRASKSGDWSVGADGAVTAGGLALVDGRVHARDGRRGCRPRRSRGGHAARRRLRRPRHDVTPELAAEGLARDVVRAVQQARKEAGLDVSDRISLTITGSDAAWDAVMAHQDLIMRETLAVQFGAAGGDRDLPTVAGGHTTTATVGDGETVHVLVSRIGS